MSWRCFMVEQTDRQRRYLRRLTAGGKKPCPELEGERGHDAWAELDVVENPVWDVRDMGKRQELAREADENDNLEELRKLVVGDVWPHDDGRWPEACAFCGREFTDTDQWELHSKDLWAPTDPDLVEVHGTFELARAPIGAMWDAWWRPIKGPDGKSLVLKLPDGWEWQIDGHADNAPGVGWERVGEPPDITVNPSIATPGYHGFLVNGELTEDVEGRTYDGGD